MKLDLKKIMHRLRRLRVRYVHVSTGPEYHPRRLSPGHVRSDAAKGSTYSVGSNARKRAKRALWRYGRGKA
jgi:hypothetical protein